MAALVFIWILVILSVIAGKAWNFYMMTHHTEKYMDLKDRDHQRKKEIGSAVAKAAGPLVLKVAERMLKK
jgi:hypothetical protein